MVSLRFFGFLSIMSQVSIPVLGVESSPSSPEITSAPVISSSRSLVPAPRNTATSSRYNPDVPLSSQCYADCMECTYWARHSPGGQTCTNPKWLDFFNGCLECAKTYDRWDSISERFQEIADSCGYLAVPSPSSAVEKTETSGPTSTSSSSSSMLTSMAAIVQEAAEKDSSKRNLAPPSTSREVTSAKTTSFSVVPPPFRGGLQASTKYSTTQTLEMVPATAMAIGHIIGVAHDPVAPTASETSIVASVGNGSYVANATLYREITAGAPTSFTFLGQILLLPICLFVVIAL